MGASRHLYLYLQGEQSFLTVYHPQYGMMGARVMIARSASRMLTVVNIPRTRSFRSVLPYHNSLHKRLALDEVLPLKNLEKLI